MRANFAILDLRLPMKALELVARNPEGVPLPIPRISLSVGFSFFFLVIFDIFSRTNIRGTTDITTRADIRKYDSECAAAEPSEKFEMRTAGRKLRKEPMLKAIIQAPSTRPKSRVLFSCGVEPARRGKKDGVLSDVAKHPAKPTPPTIPAIIR